MTCRWCDEDDARRAHTGTVKYVLSPLVMAAALLVAVVAANSRPTPADADAANDRSTFGKAVPRHKLAVSVSGNDANLCTRRAPCRTFDRAFQIARPGQVIEVATGSYPSQTVLASQRPRSMALVLFKPAAGATVRVARLDNLASRVEYRSMTIGSFYNKGFNGGTQNGVVFRNIDANTFCIGGGRNISVLGGDVGPSLSSSATGQQQPCVAKFPGQSSPAPANVLIEGVAFHDHNHADAKHTECLQIGGVTRLIVRRNTFRNCAQTASIHVGRYGAAWPSRNVVIENNFFLGNTRASSEPLGNIQYNRSEPGLVIRYNSFVGSGDSSKYSVFATFDSRPPVSPSARIYGNASYQPGHSQPDRYGPCDRMAVYSHNVWRGASCSPTDMNADPRFVNLANLHLRPGSPAIDRGDAARFPRRDIDGNRRPVGRAPDSGADERRPSRN
jgi:Protein of unknown function (DUF1565)